MPALLAISAVTLALQGGGLPPSHAPAKMDALIEPILSAWDAADVVCLGERHGSLKDSDLRIALLRHPDFARRVDVIVVEFAAPVEQARLDRFILEGEALSGEALRPVWRETGVAAWESPIYEAFLRAVHELNLSLPVDRRVRVLAGASPTDWSQIHAPEDLFPHFARGGRGGEMRTIIAEQVLQRHLKALAIYGAGHCEKRGGGVPGELEARFPGRFWVAYAFYREPAHLRNAREAFQLGANARLISISGTSSAGLRAAKFFPTGSFGDTTTTLAQMLDAIIYYGDGPDEVAEPTDVPYSPAFAEELASRGRLKCARPSNVGWRDSGAGRIRRRPNPSAASYQPAKQWYPCPATIWLLEKSHACAAGFGMTCWSDGCVSRAVSPP